MTKIAAFPKNISNRCKLVNEIKKIESIEFFEITGFSDSNLLQTKPNGIITTVCMTNECVCNSAKLLFIPTLSNNGSFEILSKEVKEINCTNQDVLNEIIYLSQTKIYLSWLGLDLLLKDPRIKSTIRRLDEDSFLSAKLAASYLCITREHFSYIFMNKVGISYSKFRSLFRMAKLLSFVKNGLKDINILSEKLNYSSPTNLYRDLRKTLNISVKDLFSKNITEIIQLLKQ